MRKHLLMRLRAPLVAFGGEAVDNYGVIRDFPAVSMVTGLIANALGWHRSDFECLDRLQRRLVMGSRLDRDGDPLRDFQTAQLASNDTGWTTFGEPETRRGGDESYKSPHLRHRDYRAGLDALVALRLEPAGEDPSLGAIARALDRPQRPLFIGRKPCLPSARLFVDIIDASDVLDALQRAPAPVEQERFRFQWPQGEGALDRASAHEVCDERNWKSGVHGGWRPVLEGTGPCIRPESFTTISPEYDS